MLWMNISKGFSVQTLYQMQVNMKISNLKTRNSPNQIRYKYDSEAVILTYRQQGCIKIYKSVTKKQRQVPFLWPELRCTLRLFHFAYLFFTTNLHQKPCVSAKAFIFYNLINLTLESMFYKLLMLCLLTGLLGYIYKYILENRTKNLRKSISVLFYMLHCQEMHI